MEIYVVVDWIEADRYRVTREDVAVDVGLNETVDGITVYRFGDLVGLEIQTSDGLFASDISGSGAYRLNRVEDSAGVMLNM